MIFLSPIAESIQNRLFEKMRVLGREKIATNKTIFTSKDELTLKELTARTTFTRMTSGLINPVVLMGGELKENYSPNMGFADIYGAKTHGQMEKKTGPLGEIIKQNSKGKYYYLEQESGNAVIVKAPPKRTTNPNVFKRPIPGIKSVDASFKGMQAAHREATISWTCWSWEDLNRLSPHFLAHQKTVMIEWGWVYDKSTLDRLPNFLKKDKATNQYKINASVYDNYKNKVLGAQGDMDLMVGVIKNFEYTTREDGGFDCQTIITSVGNSILDNIIPPKKLVSSSPSFTLSRSDNPLEFQSKLREAINDPNKSLIDFDLGVTIKAFISKLDYYVRDKAAVTGTLARASRVLSDGREAPLVSDSVFLYSKNKYIIKVTTPEQQKKGETYLPIKGSCWVRWGWFEDNILSKFLSMISSADGGEQKIITEFRSIQKILDNKGNETDKFQSVKIKNHKHLKTINLNNYILPGSFDVVDKSKFLDNNEKVIPIDGDARELVKLKGITSDTKNFLPFAVDGNPNEGYLRNMLVNTSVIKNAFGEDFGGMEAFNIREAISIIFNTINGDIPFWDFELITDEDKQGARVKIIDTQVTDFTFESDQKINKTSRGNSSTKSKFKNDVITNTGVFFFPVWQNNSLVKRQNITAKLTNSMALAAMYGANFDVLKTMGEPSSDIVEKEGIAAGAIFNDYVDSNKKNIDVAFKKEESQNIGSNAASEKNDDVAELKLDGGAEDNIREWLIKEDEANTDFIKESYEQHLTSVYDELQAGIEAGNDDKLRKRISPNKPIPLTTWLNTEQFKKLVGGNKKLQTLYGSMFHEINAGYVMKTDFINSIKRLIFGERIFERAGENKPLLIPLEVELDIDGIGGIYPGNSFHSTYLPARYQEETVFTCVDVNHRIGSGGWTVTLRGRMVATISNLVDKGIKFEEVDVEELVKAWIDAREAKDLAEIEQKVEAGVKQTKNQLEVYGVAMGPDGEKKIPLLFTPLGAANIINLGLSGVTDPAMQEKVKARMGLSPAPSIYMPRSLIAKISG
tara:strand:+ start:83 stop:3163 length:3081 start_codon:yes stop_codon:yes gene_type:complete